MKRLFLLAIVAAALWWGYQRNWDFSREAGNGAVLSNRSGQTLERVRLTIGGETLVREVLEPDARAELTFHSKRDGAFRLVWHVRGQVGEKSWSGGHLIGGPTASVHHFEFDSQHGVIWHARERTAEK